MCSVVKSKRGDGSDVDVDEEGEAVAMCGEWGDATVVMSDPRVTAEVCVPDRTRARGRAW